MSFFAGVLLGLIVGIGACCLLGYSISKRNAQ